MKSKNSAYAPLCNLRKDHKPNPDPIKGPPGRPLCSGNISYNHRLSYLLSTILENTTENEETECENTEDLISEFQRINETEISDSLIIGSMDVKALYPSLNIPHTIDKVCEIFENSNITIDNIDYQEVSHYIALNKTQEEVNQMNLQRLCPKRRRKRGPRPNITGNGTIDNKKDRLEPWIIPEIETFTTEDKKIIFKEALKIGLSTVMNNHIYEFDGILRKQTTGGAIGLQLTGTLAKLYMVWWDKMFLSKLSHLQINVAFYKRYIDDINIGITHPGNGYEYKDGKLHKDESKKEEDSIKEKDETAMQLLQKIANGIHNSIQMEIDYPSANPDKKLPILDIKVWIQMVENKRQILYEHYRKEVSTKTTIIARSATPMTQKRTILSQELLTIMTHCSPNLPTEVKCNHINHFMKRMQFSGFSKELRFDTYNSAMKAYNILKEKEENGTRPINRPKQWNKVERRKEKNHKINNWYKRNGEETVIFIPCTPGSHLKKSYEEKIKQSEFKIKVVETGGTKIKDMLHRKNPFKKKKCEREECFVCTTEGKGACDKENITYDIKCQTHCNQKSIYRGESAFNAYTRGKEHLDKLQAKDPQSVLFQHSNEHHGGESIPFKMNVTGTFHNDAMMRQITEGVNIRRTPTTKLMNTRREWHITPTPQSTIRIENDNNRNIHN